MRRPHPRDHYLPLYHLPRQERYPHHTDLLPQPRQEGSGAEGREKEGGQIVVPDVASHSGHLPPATEARHC